MRMRKPLPTYNSFQLKIHQSSVQPQTTTLVRHDAGTGGQAGKSALGGDPPDPPSENGGGRRARPPLPTSADLKSQIHRSALGSDGKLERGAGEARRQARGTAWEQGPGRLARTTRDDSNAQT